MTTLTDFVPAGVHTQAIAEKYGIVTRHFPDGSLACSAMQDRDGWHVSLNKATCLIYVEDKAEAVRLLDAIAEHLIQKAVAAAALTPDADCSDGARSSVEAPAMSPPERSVRRWGVSRACCRACDRADRTLYERIAYHHSRAEYHAGISRIATRVALAAAGVAVLAAILQVIL